MNPVISGIFSVISAVLIMYLVMILLRLLASWFITGPQPAFMLVLIRLTEPFLNFFRRFKFLQLQNFDLSPIAAIIVLQILITICSRIAAERAIWFGLILSILIEMVGGAITFFFLLFAILAAVRFFGILAGASSVQRLWFTLDHILQPMVYPIITRLSPRKVIPYGTGLGIFAGLNLGAWLLGNFIVSLLAGLARGIPF